MDNNKPRSNGSMAAISAVLGLFAVIGGVYAMVQPMNQRIDHVTEQMQKLEDRLIKGLDTHMAGKSHPGAAEDLATMSERFKEVETQFRGIKDIQATRFTEIERRLTETETDGNPRHDERIKNLERVNGIARREPK